MAIAKNKTIIIFIVLVFSLFYIASIGESKYESNTLNNTLVTNIR